MNLQDQIVYRCVSPACHRPFPRDVNYCPYCGAAQHAARPGPERLRPGLKGAAATDPAARMVATLRDAVAIEGSSDMEGAHVRARAGEPAAPETGPRPGEARVAGSPSGPARTDAPHQPYAAGAAPGAGWGASASDAAGAADAAERAAAAEWNRRATDDLGANAANGDSSPSTGIGTGAGADSTASAPAASPASAIQAPSGAAALGGATGAAGVGASSGAEHIGRTAGTAGPGGTARGAPAGQPGVGGYQPGGPGIPPPPLRPAQRPKREPIRLRYWLLALLALWLIWLYAKPGARRIEARIEHAMSLTKSCELNEAQAELIDLRSTKASPEQLQKLQKAIDSAKPACDRKRQRERDWTDTSKAVEQALEGRDPARASTRLSQYTRRHGDTNDTRKLRERINTMREQQAERAARPRAVPLPATADEHPLAVPGRSAGAAQSARNLISEAERDISLGRYQAASNKLQLCMDMVDNGVRECASYKQHADRLLRDQQRCLAARREWVRDHCE